MKRWIVSAPTDFAAIAAQAGVPGEALAWGVDKRTDIGTVEAPTKGQAILAAVARFPKIKPTELDIREEVAP